MARLATDGFSRPAVPTAPAGVAQRDFHGPSGRGRIFLACSANRASSLPYRGQRAGAGSRAGKAPWGSDWYQ